MFGLGWGEIVVIGIVALIAIGPKELPTVLRSLAQWMGTVRRMASEFQGQFHEALREAELTDLKKQAEDLTASVTNFDPIADTQKEMERAFEIPDPMASPPASTETAPAEALSATPADPAKLPEVTALPAIDVPMPEMPPQLTEKDFAPQELPSSQEPPLATETKKQAGGSA
ncbi:MAG: twin-arginine translocase subunit TatB [Pseudolabrys sp.]|nr:twin-arginine translocase subunit TatB [Pseudolabrys sp.]MSP32743.1 twin-arginine translocase subunit TatB [Pseudolabrys sp.]